MDNKIFQVGLIGFGMAGKVFHAPFLSNHPGFFLKMIKTSKLPDIEIANNKYSEAKIVASTEEILTDPEIDLIVIATPNHTHFDIARKSLSAGKHVVVDKPFTVTSEEAAELIKLAESQKKMISIYHNRRWDSDFLTLKKIIHGHLCGNIVSLEAHFDRFRNAPRHNAWKEQDLPGSGILYDLGSHLIDQALSLFGLPEELDADIRIQRKGGKAPDYFLLQLFYRGLVVKLSAGMLVKSPAVKYLLTGENGSYIKYGMDIQEEQLKNGYLPLAEASWGKEPESLWGTIDTTLSGLSFTGKIESEHGDYRKYYNNIHDVLSRKAMLEVGPHQAMTNIAIIELAIKSNLEKKRIPLTQHVGPLIF